MTDRPFQPTFAYGFDPSNADVRVILAPSSGGPVASYVASITEDLYVQSISVDVDCTVSINDVAVEATLLDRSGFQLGSVRTGAPLTAGYPGQATFAPGLPDSSTFNAGFPVTQTQTSLWDMQLSDGETIQLSALETAAVITQARILVAAASAFSGFVEIPPPVGMYQGQ